MKKRITIILAMILLIVTCTASTAVPPAAEEPEPEPQVVVVQVQHETEPIQEEPEVEIEEEPIEHEFAHFVWNYLKDLGYSDAVAAGIIGNMMVEVGGNTLDLQPLVETDEYYGVCQWKKEYYPAVVGASLEEQCDFLRDSIEYEIKTFHPKYSYKQFLELSTARKAALAFAKGYERCSKDTYKLRQDCAEKAYKYFVDYYQ